MHQVPDPRPHTHFPEIMTFQRNIQLSFTCCSKQPMEHSVIIYGQKDGCEWKHLTKQILERDQYGQKLTAKHIIYEVQNQHSIYRHSY